MATYFTSCISFKNNADLNFYFSFSFLFHYAQCARFCFIIFVVFQWQLKVNWFRCFWVGVQEILYHWAGPMLSFSLPWPLRMWKYCSPTCFTLQILSIAFAPIHQESLNIHAVEWKSTGFYMFNNHQSNQGYHLLQKTINEVSMCLFITVYKINNHRHHRRVTKNAYLCTFQVHKWSKTCTFQVHKWSNGPSFLLPKIRYFKSSTNIIQGETNPKCKRNYIINSDPKCKTNYIINSLI